MSAEVSSVGTHGRLDELLASPCLVVDGRELTGRDLLAAGVVSGRWQRLERDVADALGLVAAKPPQDAEVHDALKAFRIERGLLSAEDLRAWMAKRGLAFAAVKGVAARAVARGRGVEPQEVTPPDVVEALPAELICTGVLQEIGLWLADRLLSAATAGNDEPPIEPEERRVQRLVFEEARTVAGGVVSESGVERAERLRWIAGLDDAHGSWEAGAVGEGAIARRLREKELDWCRYELDELRLTSAGAAAEAARQLAEGAHADAVAAAAGRPLEVRAVIVADAPPVLAHLLAGAVADDVVGPWIDGEYHVVDRVRDRRIPDLLDEPSVARARRELLEETITRLRAGRIRWHDGT